MKVSSNIILYQRTEIVNYGFKSVFFFIYINNLDYQSVRNIGGNSTEVSYEHFLLSFSPCPFSAAIAATVSVLYLDFERTAR